MFEGYQAFQYIVTKLRAFAPAVEFSGHFGAWKPSRGLVAKAQEGAPTFSAILAR